MCDCVPYPLLPSSIQTSKLGLTSCDWRPRIGLLRDCTIVGDSRLQFDSSRSNGGELHTLKSIICVKANRNSRVSRYEEFEDYDELGFFKEKKREKKDFELETSEGETELEKLASRINEDGRVDDGSVSSSFDFVELKNRVEDEMMRSLKDDEEMNGAGSKLEESVKLNAMAGLKGRRQTMTRSNLLAKQVISIQSALSLGFVSQLWVDTSSWVVLVVEVRPNLLSGESERFLLEDVEKVGDIVLVQDESVMESSVRIVGLETLVGYNVVTPARRNIGKVRGYNFNINSGDVESLELDSFGISIIPSTLVSTYALFVEDVMEVVSDTVVVHEAAASRIQRLSKGFWGSQKVQTSIDKLEEYSDLERQPLPYDHDQRKRRSSSRRKSHPKMRDIEDDWELPMDYLL